MIVGGSAWESTPWRAVQRTAWTLNRRTETVMQLAGRAWLVVVLILSSVATASAESTWVLWEQWVLSAQTGSEAEDIWTVVKAYGGRDECERVQWQRASRDAAVENAANARNPDRNGQWRIWYLCAPDTVDPREPKAK
jgi:hypothetical protein